ncbi:MAG: DUF1330 domain-containing protein [Gammaproteobacteria bacterium]
MAGYVIATVTVKDPERYERYKALVAPSVAAYGGRYLVRGGETQSVEGGWNPSRVVVLEFESAQRAKAWWDSEEYAEAKALRHATADSQMVIVSGI